jgi:predicted HTH transcriptional regulator
MCINSVLEKTTQRIKLNNNQLKIIELIKENPKITRNELASELRAKQWWILENKIITFIMRRVYV